jgi:hydrogenase maturation protease
MNNKKNPHITVLGLGNILLRDEGLGVRVVERLSERYEFDENVELLDGGVLGMRLIGIVSACDVLIVTDAICNGGQPGTLYRLEGDQVPRRVLAKHSLHQLDFPEVLALCETIDHRPETIILGMEPEDMSTMDVALTPTVAERLDRLGAMVLTELDRLGAGYRPK